MPRLGWVGVAHPLQGRPTQLQARNANICITTIKKLRLPAKTAKQGKPGHQAHCINCCMLSCIHKESAQQARHTRPPSG